MQIENYLKTYQPIIYQITNNQLLSGKVPHAYLLSGDTGTPLLEVAKFLGKSLLCDDSNPFACNSCITCMRVDDNNYPDFIVIDGSESQIKKESITNIITRFDKTAFEDKGIMIYVIHLVENVAPNTIQTILKFLEEPSSQVYAFLTTNNENIVLPTIISRCQLLRLKLRDRNDVINSAINEGIAENDAEYLSYFYNDAELIREVINSDDNENYQKSKTCIEGLLATIVTDGLDAAMFYAETTITNQIKTKEEARYFVDMLTMVLEEISNIKNRKPIYLKTCVNILSEASKIFNNIEEKILEVLKAKKMINTNVNIALLLDHLYIKLFAK